MGFHLKNFDLDTFKEMSSPKFYQVIDNLGKKVIQALQSVLEHVLITVAGL